MEKIGLVLLGFIAVVALVGLVNLDTGTGQVYYSSYQYTSVIVAGRLVNGPANGYVEGTGDGETVAIGTVTNGVYQLTLSSGWRQHQNIDFYVNGKKCNSIPVSQYLVPPQILYSGQIAFDMMCTP
jgi:hypothetical protein